VTRYSYPGAAREPAPFPHISVTDAAEEPIFVMIRIAVLTTSVAGMLLLLAGCTSVRNTSPAHSAKEDLLINTAADRAAEALAAQVPPNLAAWIDTGGMLVREDRNGVYALATIEDALLRHGVRLVGDRVQADAVIVPRAGMLSTYEKGTLFGIPSLPIPLAPGLVSPSLSLYSQNLAKGVAKFAASVYDAKTGKLIVSTDPAYGFSREDDGVVLFLFDWDKNDMGVDFKTNPPKVLR